MTSNKEKLNNKITIMDPLHIAEFNPMQSPYTYSGYEKLTNTTENYQPLTPIGTTTPNLSSEVRWQIPKRQTFLGDVLLSITTSALTPVGGGTARFIDYAGYWFVKQFIARYGSNQLQRLDPKILHQHHSVHHGDHEYDAELVLAGGGLSVAEREARALAPQTFLFALPFWWTKAMGLHVITDGLAALLELSLTLPAAAEVTQATSGTPPSFTITDIRLLANLIQTEDTERNYRIDTTMNDPGMIYAIKDTEEQLNNVLAAGQTTYTINLDSIKGSVTSLFFTVKPFVSENSPGTVANQPTNFLTNVVSWKFVAGGITIWADTADLFNRYYLNRKYYSARPGGPYYGYSPALDPTDPVNSTGHDPISAFSNPQLVLTFAADPGQVIVDVITEDHNSIQHFKGDLQKIFH